MGGGRTCCESIWSSVGHPVIPVLCSCADVGSTCRRASAAANLRAVGSGPSTTAAGTRPGAVGAGVGTTGSGTGAGAELKSVVAVAEPPASKSPKSCECNRATHNERLHAHAGWLWSLCAHRRLLRQMQRECSHLQIHRSRRRPRASDRRPVPVHLRSRRTHRPPYPWVQEALGGLQSRRIHRPPYPGVLEAQRARRKSSRGRLWLARHLRTHLTLGQRCCLRMKPPSA